MAFHHTKGIFPPSEIKIRQLFKCPGSDKDAIINVIVLTIAKL